MVREALLKVRNLRTNFYTYKGVVKALDGVNLTVGYNDWVGLVGETGCGKSVTALSIMRLIPPPGKIVEGEVRFKGVNLLELGEKEMREVRGAQIALIFQDPTSSLNPVLRVGLQISEPIMYHKALYEKMAKDTSLKDLSLNLLKELGVPDAERRVDSYPFELSGGMRQRVMIAIALSCNPDLIIADEPTTNLDVTVQAQILSLMKEIQRKYRSSILYITHNFGVIAATCERVGVMYSGAIVEFGDVSAIFKNPKHPYTIGLMKAIPKVHEKRRMLETIPGVVPDLIDPPSGCRFHPRCSHIMDICRKVKPREIEVEPGHIVSCHLYDQGV